MVHVSGNATWHDYPTLDTLVTATALENIEKAIDAPPIFSAASGVTQTITAGAFVPINFATHVVDTAGGHSTTTNTSRYTATVPGWYHVSGLVATSGNTGSRASTLYLNGSEYLGSGSWEVANSGSATRLPTPGRLILMNGTTDYVELVAFADVASATSLTSSLDIYFVRGP